MADASPARSAPLSSARRSRWSVRLIIVGAAVATAVLVWLIAVPLLQVDLLVAPGGTPAQPVGIGAVLLASLSGGFAGWAVLTALERISRKGRIIWTVTAIAVLLASLAGPITSGANDATVLTLTTMHMLVGGVLIVGLRHTSPRPRPGGEAL